MPYEPIALTTFDDTLNVNALTNYTYTNKDDSLATIQADGYFDKDFPSTDNAARSIKIDDRITIKGSDGSVEVRVTDVLPIIKVVAAGSAFTIVTSFVGTATDGQSSSTFAAPGVLPTDAAFANIIQSGNAFILIKRVIPDTDQLFITFDGNPGGSPTLVSILVVR